MKPSASEILMQRIERQTRRLRAGLILLAIMAVAVQVGLILLVLQTDSKLETAIHAIKDTAASNHQQINTQLQALQDQHRQQDQYILCLAEEFSGPRPAECKPPFPGSGGEAQQVTGSAQSAALTPAAATPASSPAAAQPASPQATTPAPAPTPAPTPTPAQTIQKILSNLTGGLL